MNYSRVAYAYKKRFCSGICGLDLLKSDWCGQSRNKPIAATGCVTRGGRSAVEMPRCGWPWKTLGSQERADKLALAFSTAFGQNIHAARL
jgi:hypothetical protein